MTTRQYSSRSQQSTLTAAITSGATSMTVVSGTGLLGGVTIPAGRTFTLVLDPDTALEEIVDATAVSTNTFTITRAVDGSSAQDHSAGAVVRHMAIGRDYRDANLHAEADAYYNDGSGTGHTMHGIGSGEGVVVGTLKTQTLTNKTLTAPTITDPTITGTASAGAVLVFEGTTADAFETTLTVVDPTQDNTITLPNTSGTVILTTATQTLTNKTLTSPVISGSPVITGLSSAGMVASSATPKDYVDSILGSATAAATSAASAATSASSAATSASSAATSASNALTSANSAATSATAAATSAASAATSATAAATSATSAAASATTAANSASAAATSASSAATSASSALTSANSASTSATASASSASASATSATAAATSATSAAASATAAATSATSAAASATAAATSATSAAASATTAANSATAAATSATSAAASATAAATSEANASASATAAATSASSASTSASSALTSANSASTSAASAATSASSAAASFDSFDDRYLGPKASAPTTDNDGNPLTGGVLYYNTTSGVMFVYNGNTSAWEQVAVSTSGFPTLAGNNNFTGLNTFTNAGTADVLRVTNTGTGNSLVVEDSTNPDATPFVIDQNGAVAIGNVNRLTAGGNQLVSIFGAGTNYPLVLGQYLASSAGPRLTFAKTRSTTPGTFATVVAGDVLGENYFYGDDGTSFVASARIAAQAEGTISTGVIPSRLIFSTADSAGTVTERMRINSEGSVGIGTTSLTGINFRLGKSITGGTTAYGMYLGGSVQSDVTSTGFGLLSQVTTAASAFTITNLIHFAASPSALGAGSTVSNQYGFYAESTLGTAGSATLSAAFGFYGNLAAASGRYNLYMGGTASNYLAGRFGVGATLNSGAMAQVTNTTAADVGFIVKGAASQTSNILQVRDSAETILFRVDSAGNLGVNNIPTYKLDVTSATVGNTAGNQSQAFRLNAIDGNSTSLEITNTRTANGSSWETAGFRLQTKVDATYMGYIQFNGGNNSGISFGTGSSSVSATSITERMRIDSSGNVNIGTGTGGGTNTAGLSIAGKDIELMTLMGAF